MKGKLINVYLNESNPNVLMLDFDLKKEPSRVIYLLNNRNVLKYVRQICFKCQISVRDDNYFAAFKSEIGNLFNLYIKSGKYLEIDSRYEGNFLTPEEKNIIHEEALKTYSVTTNRMLFGQDEVSFDDYLKYFYCRINHLTHTEYYDERDIRKIASKATKDIQYKISEKEKYSENQKMLFIKMLRLFGEVQVSQKEFSIVATDIEFILSDRKFMKHLKTESVDDIVDEFWKDLPLIPVEE